MPELTPEQISQLIDLALGAATIFFPGLGLYFATARRTKNELLKVFKDLPMGDELIHQIATDAKQEKAAKALEFNLEENNHV